MEIEEEPNTGVLREFIEYEARPGNLYKIDLLPDRIEEVEGLSPNTEFTYGDVEIVPSLRGQ